MHFLRYEKDGETAYGLLREGLIYRVDGDIFGQYEVGVKVGSPDAVRTLAPVLPSKVVGMGINYFDFIKSMNIPKPETPYIFLKSPTTIVGSGDEIILPRAGDVVNYEAELGVVIGKYCKNVSPTNALNYVFGYTCVNDLTNRTDLLRDNHMGAAKNYDTFLPMGPGIETNIGWEDRRIRLWQNGKLNVDGNTNSMIFGLPETIAFVSAIMPLLPGDVILTGAPAGVASIASGDTLEIEIDGVGRLFNTVTYAV